ncbi:transcription factor AP-2 [Ostertagia ostertagi]
MFAEQQLQFGQELHAEQLLANQMRSRKRPNDDMNPNVDPAKRMDNRNKENCSPELAMVPPMYQSTPLMAGQREFFNPNMASQDESRNDSIFESNKQIYLQGQATRLRHVNLEVFDEAPGRLCLLNASTKYKVTLSEIHRRMSHPETLHASLINGVLRKAKTKDGCKMLRDRLAEKGVSLPSGRRKTAPTTSFTALCEREALVMARDFNNLCHNSLNTFEIARHSNRLQYTPQELAIVRRYLAGIMAIFDEVPEDPEDYVEKNSATHSINIFSMLTHGFGHNALKSAWRVLAKIVDTQHAMLQGVPPQTQNFHMPYHMQQFL